MKLQTHQNGQTIRVEIQLILPNISAPLPVSKTRSKVRAKPDSSEPTLTPIEPTGAQNAYVLQQLRIHPSGLTSVEFVALGVADPRPRIRDLRALGHKIYTEKDHPHAVGLYVLIGGCDDH